jgi:hypothetical protein
MNLMNLQNSLENQDREYNIKASLIVAMDRLRVEPFDIHNMYLDIESEYKRVSTNEIQNAIRNGSIGKYGSTYKFNTQSVCIWINQYLENKNKRNLGI